MLTLVSVYSFYFITFLYLVQLRSKWKFVAHFMVLFTPKCATLCAFLLGQCGSLQFLQFAAAYKKVQYDG